MKKVNILEKGNFNKGVTLIALIITIIVLLILVGVTIAQLVNSGIFNKAQLAKETNNLATQKEELELEIANLKINMYSDSTKKKATLNDLKSYLEDPKFNGNYKVELSYEPASAKVTHIPSKFIFDVDEKLTVINGNKISDMADKKPEGLVGYWKLNSSLSNEISGGNDLVIYKGTPQYQEDGSVYLNDAVLSTNGNSSLSSNFTIELQVKIVVALPCHDNCNPIIGVGQTASGVGATCVAEWWSNTGNFWITNGLGDSYSRGENAGDSTNNTWYTLVLRSDGTKLELFKNGQKVAETNGVSLKNTPLYLGGLPTSHPDHFGKSAVEGYFKNLCVYDRALSDEEIANLK